MIAIFILQYVIYVKNWIWRVSRRLGVWSDRAHRIPEHCVGLRTRRDRAWCFECYGLVSSTVESTDPTTGVN